MGIEFKNQNRINNDEHDDVALAKRVKIVEGNVSINAGDIQIGAVEIKDETTNNRLLVNLDGSIETNIKTNDSDLFSNYKTNDIDEPTPKITYVGQSKPTGEWLLLKIDETTNTTLRYANVSNNALYSTYADAWTNRAALVFQELHNLNF